MIVRFEEGKEGSEEEKEISLSYLKPLYSFGRALLLNAFH